MDSLTQEAQLNATETCTWLLELAQVWKMRPNPRSQLKEEKEAARKNKYTSYAYDLNRILHSSPFAFWSTYWSM